MKKIILTEEDMQNIIDRVLGQYENEPEAPEDEETSDVESGEDNSEGLIKIKRVEKEKSDE